MTPQQRADSLEPRLPANYERWSNSPDLVMFMWPWQNDKRLALLVRDGDYDDTQLLVDDREGFPILPAFERGLGPVTPERVQAFHEKHKGLLETP